MSAPWRSHEHPGIVFRSGPTGRRAAVAGGPDVWQIIAALNAVRDEEPQADRTSLLGALGEVTGQSATQIGVALRYYAAYPGEIDERIAVNEDVAEREERLWEAQRKSLQSPRPAAIRGRHAGPDEVTWPQ